MIPDSEFTNVGSSSFLRYRAASAADYGDMLCVGSDAVDGSSGHPCSFQIILKGTISNAGQSLMWPPPFNCHLLLLGQNKIQSNKLPFISKNF